MDTSDQLIQKLLVVDPTTNVEKVVEAYNFAMHAHRLQKRASGEPYFMHPVAVAHILIDMRVDWQSVVTALLHDTVEDTEATLEQIESNFGAGIASLVNGVTKLGQVELTGDGTSSAENFRKLFLAMVEDIRVLLVKLADRLHNMRTLEHIKKPGKKERKSRETLEIYAPLAERMGMERLKEELQDRAFFFINPDARQFISQRVEAIASADQSVFGDIIRELSSLFVKHGIKTSITGRVKSNYSIWTKMQAKSVDFEQLSDIMAFRILVKDIPDCYVALGILHSAYAMVPGRFKDYISLPKKNGYQSLHTGIIGPENRKIEVQIRTHQMHETNEYGLAAHWAYKQGASIGKEILASGDAGKEKQAKQPEAGSKPSFGSTNPYEWLREMRELLESTENPDEFLEHTKMEMFRDQVFVFTPGGRLIGLPAGATPVDFAYEVHTDIGNKCVGAKVNGRIRPLQTVLSNGDQVEILTAKNSEPSMDWLNFVVSGKAKARLRKFKRLRERGQYIELGRKMLMEAFRLEGLDYSDKALQPGLKKLKKAEVEDLLLDTGAGFTSTREVLHAVFVDFKYKQKQKLRNEALNSQKLMERSLDNFASKSGGRKPASYAPYANGTVKANTTNKSKSLPIKGLIPGLALHYARCCHPLRGDRIVGITTTGKGVTIHTLDCITLEQFQDQPERWLSVSWEQKSGDEGILTGRMSVIINNEPGSLASVTAVIGKNDGNISNWRFVSRSSEFFEVLVDVEVHNAASLTHIIGALRANRHIVQVSRARG